MFGLFKKEQPVVVQPRVVTVQEIHDDFDQAEERCIQMFNNLMEELKIPSESDIERKGELLAKVGFTSSEGHKAFQRVKRSQEERRKIKEKLDFISRLKQEYPLEKFITEKELETLCAKYNLIYATFDRYIKDVPEKNLLEIAHAKPMHYHFKQKNYWLIKPVVHMRKWKPDKEIEAINNLKKIGVVSDRDPRHFHQSTVRRIIASAAGVRESLVEAVVEDFIVVDKIKDKMCIAAPKSHFNLGGLDIDGYEASASETLVLPDDPIVFEFCEGGLVRIITKWGTEDDQSYLDPVVMNEKLN